MSRAWGRYVVWCPRCRRKTGAMWEKRNQSWHGLCVLMTLLTCGLWLLVWLPSLAVLPRGGYVCERCGSDAWS